MLGKLASPWPIGVVCLVLAGTGVAVLVSGPVREHASAAALQFVSSQNTASGSVARRVPGTMLGINLTRIVWYSNERAFSNLALGGYWQFAPRNQSWSDLGQPFVTSDGSLSSLPLGGDAVRMLTMPDTPAKGSLIRCTYTGKGELTARGNAIEVSARPGQVTFRWINRWQNNVVWLQVHSIDPATPISRIDCRETDAAASARFDPGFLASLEGYKTLRFMDWQRTNENAPGHWNDRHTPASLDITTGTGVAVEDIVALAKAVRADAWVTCPWNADDDYVARFANLMHDGLPSDRATYVEVGNEVWNGGFPAARQALAEGQTRGLGQSPRETQMRRYAQRTIEVMRIWERVFVDNPKRLVRVVSTQHVVPDAAEIIFRYQGLADHVDALATAPYFGFDMQVAGPTGDLSENFRKLDAAVSATIVQAVTNRAIAARYGKRYLAYEAGQHIVLPTDVPLLERIERDPRMYETYRRYIQTWQAQVGDVLTLFTTTGSIGPGGAWGLAEHSGQSPAEAPKLRASLETRADLRVN